MYAVYCIIVYMLSNNAYIAKQVNKMQNANANAQTVINAAGAAGYDYAVETVNSFNAIFWDYMYAIDSNVYSAVFYSSANEFGDPIGDVNSVIELAELIVEHAQVNNKAFYAQYAHLIN